MVEFFFGNYIVQPELLAGNGCAVQRLLLWYGKSVTAHHGDFLLCELRITWSNGTPFSVQTQIVVTNLCYKKSGTIAAFYPIWFER
jgi:hypothetical protein